MRKVFMVLPSGKTGECRANSCVCVSSEALELSVTERSFLCIQDMHVMLIPDTSGLLLLHDLRACNGDQSAHSLLLGSLCRRSWRASQAENYNHRSVFLQLIGGGLSPSSDYPLHYYDSSPLDPSVALSQKDSRSSNSQDGTLQTS